MADLYNLDAEIEDYAPQEEEAVDQIGGDQQEWEETEEYVDDVGLPEALREAAEARRQNLPQSTDEDLLLELKDLQGTGVKSSELLLQDLPYTRLYNAWSQECHAPELLPLDHATVRQMRQCLQENDDERPVFDTGNANMDALFESVLRIDAKRVKFLLADLMKRRLQKIEAHPFWLLRNTEMADHMSAYELEFLKKYGAAVERHFQTTVTDHFPQDVWKQLDAPDMIDEPDLDAFVFLKCLQDVIIGDKDHLAGTCLIIRYNRVRDFFSKAKSNLSRELCE